MYFVRPGNCDSNANHTIYEYVVAAPTPAISSNASSGLELGETI